MVFWLNGDWSSGIACHVRTALLWVITQRRVVIPYWRFGIAYRSHLQGTRIQKESRVSLSGVYTRKSVGSNKFSVTWCQPVGSMQVVGREGSVVVSASSIQNNVLHDLTFITDFCCLHGYGGFLNLLAPELFFQILAHSVYKMWIKQEPNTLELWNKLHFEEKKTDSIYHV